jgi:hypothetical protein
MLKKGFHIAIIIILLVSTSGIIIDSHYCCGRLVSTTLGKSKDCCTEPGCCRHELKLLKVQDNFQLSQFNAENETHIIPILYPELNFVLPNQVYRQIIFTKVGYSPPWYKTSASFLQVFLV